MKKPIYAIVHSDELDPNQWYLGPWADKAGAHYVCNDCNDDYDNVKYYETDLGVGWVVVVAFDHEERALPEIERLRRMHVGCINGAECLAQYERSQREDPDEMNVLEPAQLAVAKRLWTLTLAEKAAAVRDNVPKVVCDSGYDDE